MIQLNISLKKKGVNHFLFYAEFDLLPLHCYLILPLLTFILKGLAIEEQTLQKGASGICRGNKKWWGYAVPNAKFYWMYMLYLWNRPITHCLRGAVVLEKKKELQYEDDIFVVRSPIVSSDHLCFMGAQFQQIWNMFLTPSPYSEVVMEAAQGLTQLTWSDTPIFLQLPLGFVFCFFSLLIMQQHYSLGTIQ